MKALQLSLVAIVALAIVRAPWPSWAVLLGLVWAGRWAQNVRRLR